MNPTALGKLSTALGQTHDPALSGCDHCADTVRLPRDVEFSIDLRHTRRRHRELREPIKSPQRSPFKPTLRLKCRRLACDPNRVALRGEGSNHRTRTLTGD
jgi:hypothetical protein